MDEVGQFQVAAPGSQAGGGHHSAFPFIGLLDGGQAAEEPVPGGHQVRHRAQGRDEVGAQAADLGPGMVCQERPEGRQGLVPQAEDAGHHHIAAAIVVEAGHGAHHRLHQPGAGLGAARQEGRDLLFQEGHQVGPAARQEGPLEADGQDFGGVRWHPAISAQFRQDPPHAGIEGQGQGVDVDRQQGR